MNSNRLFLWATFAVFAFAIASVLVLGSPIKKYQTQEDDLLLSFFGFEYSDNCESGAIWDLPLQKEIAFFYYTKENPEGTLFDFDFQPIPGILYTTETKILTHGFRGSISEPELRAIITAYLNRSDELNVLALNWTSYSSGKYREAAKSAVAIGKATSSLFCILYKYYDIYPHQMHFIGYGLGAHLLAATARESRKRVGRITGLDPARLCFEEQCNHLFYPQLSRNDAEFVDILHTDANKHGVRNPQGTVDFYANRGRNQPMCHEPNAVIPVAEDCEPKSAYLYFKESILIPTAFYGIRCETIHPILNCDKNAGFYWGEYMETIAVGMYNFNTRGKSPFGEGKIKFDAALVPSAKKVEKTIVLH